MFFYRFNKNKFKKKFVFNFVFNIVILINLAIVFCDCKFYATTLSINDVYTYTENTSTKLKNKKFSLATKKIKLQQAKEAIKDARKKENTVRFSLPFNIRWPEKHAMPKEIELLMKVPEIESEIKTLNKELQEIKLSEREKAGICFVEVCEYEKKYKMAEEILVELNQKLSNIKIDLARGKASQKDVQTLENKITAQESKVAGLLTSFERSKEKLSEIVGFRVSSGDILKTPFQKTDIDRTYIDKLVDFTIVNDFGLYQAEQEEKIAIEKTNKIYEIYGNKWGETVRKIETEVRQSSGIDYDQFLDKYNSLLTDIDKPWNGNYTINLLFFKLKIPKEWFKGEFDGVRYFEDQKYAVFLAIKEKEDAINNTKLVKKELVSNVRDSFETLKKMYKSYLSSVVATKQSKKEYDRVYLLNKSGSASFDEVDVEKLNWESAQETELDNLVSYSKQLISFNRLTCGAIDAMTESIEIFLNAAQTGDSMAEYQDIVEDQEDAIIYYINTAVDQRKVVFGLQPLSGYQNDLTHYEVLAQNGLVVAKKTEINNQISVLPIEYQGSTEMRVRLYNNEEFVDEGTFDAMNSRGKLVLSQKSSGLSVAKKSKEEQLETEESVIGSYEIVSLANNAVKKIKFNVLDKQGVSYYKIFNQEQSPIKEQDRYYLLKDSFSYLGFVLNDLSKLEINFYDANHNLKFVAGFDERNNQIVKIKK